MPHMKDRPSTPPLTRLVRSLKNKTRQSLQHFSLRLIEQTPAPYKFALRNILFTNFSFLYVKTEPYLNWQAALMYFDQNRSSQIKLIDLKKISPPTNLAPKKIAIQAHIFYQDLAAELASLLVNFPAPFDLLISTPNKEAEELIRNQFQGISNLQNLQILITPNRGRDLGPMLYGFGGQLLNYDYFAHVHTKKSTNSNDIGNAWRKYLVKGLLDSSNDRTSKILGLLEEFGLVYPQKFPLIDVQNCQWGNNLIVANELCAAMNVHTPAPGYIEFPAGSMFWAKTAALKPLLEHPFAIEDFEIEAGQTDRTIMHAIERSLSHICLAQGYPVALLSNPSSISFYP
jgi:lipopolysaccharide biosynthesis protein